MSIFKSRDDVLLEFAIEPQHDRETLERYLHEYPNLAEDLIDMCHELRLMRNSAPSHVDAECTDQLKTAFNQLVAAGSSTAEIANIFQSYKGQAFAELARALNLPRSILQALRDRLVDPTSIPIGFLRRLTLATQNDIAAAKQYFLLPPAAEVGLSFRADGKPGATGQITFAELVAATASLTDEQRAILQDEISAHGLQ